MGNPFNNPFFSSGRKFTSKKKAQKFVESENRFFGFEALRVVRTNKREYTSAPNVRRKK